jgi:hypothetical protein
MLHDVVDLGRHSRSGKPVHDYVISSNDARSDKVAPQKSRNALLRFWRTTWRMLSLLKNVFGQGNRRPTVATGNSLSGEWSLGYGYDAIVAGLWTQKQASKRTLPR